MPYIKKQNRKPFDELVVQLVDKLLDSKEKGGNEANVGDVNYVISSIIWTLFNTKKSYTTGNNLMGVLECVKQEFYRRQLAPYEDEKIKENGDL
jgi:hypothetical protein